MEGWCQGHLTPDSSAEVRMKYSSGGSPFRGIQNPQSPYMSEIRTPPREQRGKTQCTLLCTRYQRRTHSIHDTAEVAMRFSSALIGVGSLCTEINAFVPVAPVLGSGRGVNSPSASVRTVVAPAKGTSNLVMLLGGSKKGGVPKSISSKISNIFRGSRSKG